jgi:hypothetical protein
MRIVQGWPEDGMWKWKLYSFTGPEPFQKRHAPTPLIFRLTSSIKTTIARRVNH